MENFINQAKTFMATENGQKMEQAIEKQTGVDLSKYLGGQQGNATNAANNDNNNNAQKPSQDAFGNAGAPGQYGEQGQYGAVTGQGFGGGLNQNQNQNQNHGQGQSGQFGQQGQYGAVTGQGLGGGFNQGGNQGKEGRGQSAYEGYEAGDSTASGGYGRNAQGGAFSRQNQMGTDNHHSGAYDVEDGNEGYRTGTSTPGYRQEGDVDAEAAENRIRNQNLNTYGQQSDERGSKGNDYHEAI